MAFVPTQMRLQGEEEVFERRLIDLLNHFLVYEEKKSREAALKVVPLEDLRQIAQARYDSCSSESSEATGKDKTNMAAEEVRDLLLLELLNWFKTEFFTWMDCPPCSLCSAKKTIPLGEVMPTFEERSRSAARVETYTCHECYPPSPGGHERGKEVARFPRYNSPVVLLETRTGRCGEWANCFALICRASDFETRHVSDWTDHVWVEVFSKVQNRWLHCDPCENTCDNPLLYETGWGKQLSYIIAVSQDDIQDVTWRYTHSKNLQTVLERRKLVPENWLVSTIIRLRKQRQSWLTDTRKQILVERLVKELVEFLTPTKTEAKDSEKIGRESGSLAWRKARGEVDSCFNMGIGFEWELPSEGDKFNLTYNCSEDKYVGGSDGKIVKKGWMSGVFLAENVVRKEEQDWKMVYLAREGNSNVAKISWKFFIPPVGKIRLIRAVKLTVASARFHSDALISIEIITPTKTIKIPESNCDIEGKWEWNSNELKLDCEWILVECKLEGGTSWQHAQLFRQQMSGVTSTPPFSIQITFNE